METTGAHTDNEQAKPWRQQQNSSNKVNEQGWNTSHIEQPANFIKLQAKI